MQHTQVEQPPKIRVTFLLDPAQHDSLVKLCADRGAPMSEVIRRSIALWLREQEQDGGIRNRN